MNNRTSKYALCIATAATSLGIAAPAIAAAARGVEEVIVTAQRNDERLQDVPISITVYDQQQLSDRNVVNAADLATYTPSLSVDKRFGSSFTTFSIRGFSQEFRTASSVGVYFADVVAPRGGGVATTAGDGGGPGSFFDLQNVQVLKGPQGTLFGRNTTGGDVLIVPQRPTDKLEGYLEGSVGNYDMRRLQGVINIPLTASARLRVGVDRETREGYLNNKGIGPSHLANTDYITGRASLIVDITPTIENYTIASYTDSDTYGAVSQVFVANPAAASSPTSAVLSTLVKPQVTETKRDFYSVYNDLKNPKAWLHQYQLINTTAWEANDRLTVKNIASYSVIMSDVASDTFGTNLTYPGLGNLLSVSTQTPEGLHTTNQYNITEELQLQGRTADDGLEWQTGLYYEKSAPRDLTGSRSGTFAVCSDLSSLRCTFGSASDSLGTLEYQNVAAYGQGTYQLTDDLKITAGLRYTEDRTYASNELIGYSFRSTGATTVTCKADGSHTTPCPKQYFDNATRAPTGTIDLEYSPMVDTLAYAKYSRGYRQGGINPFGGAGLTSYNAEHVNAYEIGAKKLFNGSIPGMLNLSAFYNDLSDQQLQALLYQSTNTTNATTAIANAGKSRIYGLELESSILPFDGFKLDASAAYLETKIIQITPPSLPANSPYNVAQFYEKGGPLPFTPKYKASITGTYTLPLPERIGKVSFATTYTYQSGSLTAPEASTPYHNTDSSDLVNLNLNWVGVMGSPIDTSLFVTNLFNNEYATFISGLYRQAGFETRAVGEPRMFGMRVRYSFGR